MDTDEGRLCNHELHEKGDGDFRSPIFVYFVYFVVRISSARGSSLCADEFNTNN